MKYAIENKMKTNKMGGNYGYGTLTPSSYIQINADSLRQAWWALIKLTFLLIFRIKWTIIWK